MQIVSETDGTVCSLDDALAIFLFKSKRGKRPWPWKVVFEIGPDIRISTTGYIHVSHFFSLLDSKSVFDLLLVFCSPDPDPLTFNNGSLRIRISVSNNGDPSLNTGTFTELKNQRRLFETKVPVP
jgi:hypothetical protein